MAPARGSRRILLVFFLLGAIAVITQSLLLREFLVTSFGNELSWGLTFFGWLAGIALGAAVGGRVSRNGRWRLGAFAGGIALLALLSPCQIAVVRLIRGTFDVGVGEYLSLLTMLWLNPILTVPVSFLIGFAFPLASALLSGEAPSAVASGGADPIARVYTVEATGSLLGGALFSFVLIEHVAPFQLLVGTGALLLAAPALLVTARKRTRAALVGLPAAFLIAGILWSGSVERMTIEGRWKSFRTGTELVAPGPVDSRYQNITLARREDEYTVFLDGLGAMSFPNPAETARTVHFVMCQATRVHRVLLIGGGPEGLISEILKHPVERLDYVTLDPRLIELVREHLPRADRDALGDRRLRIHYDDGRHFLVHHEAAAKYDLIFMDMPEPSSILLNRFYTEEFFELIARRLAPRGLFAFQLTASPGYFSETRRKYLGSVWKPLGWALPERLATWGETTFILASHEAGVFTADGNELLRRYTTRGVRSDRFNPLWFEGGSDLLVPHNLEKMQNEMTTGSRAAEPNTDDKPRAYLHNLVLWDRIVSGPGTSQFEWLDRVDVTGVLVAAVGLFAFWVLLARLTLRKPMIESATLFSVATTGFASMSLELILLVTFQSLYGYVYVRVGIIVGVFMLGLVGGSLLMKRLIRQRPGLGLRTLLHFDQGIMAFAFLIPGAFVLLDMATAGGRLTWLVEWGVMTLVLVSGLLGGSIFPLSANIVSRSGKDAGRTAGSVDAADHIGACLGALVAGVVLIPAIGIAFTCYAIAILKLLSCLFLIFARPRPAATARTGA